ncbi:hypothetical protein [Lacibacter sp.]|uniref:hypothetical protein n=1 Tax=Lacibacter sp. TaxID=1915409 RepID=UPI002B4B1AEA|nr:hypothetical protein [Lacibacter sp.]HLP36451.1 hypothetical protein [Lacibacter sp.]
MRKLIFILLLLQQSFAQAGAGQKYLLYHVNKNVQRVENGKKEIARRGMFLMAPHTIILQPQADVMLVQNDGKSLLLNKPGIYTFNRISQLFNSENISSLSSGFFSYVFEKFLQNENADEQQKVTAVVFRGKKAMQLPVDSSFIFSFPVTLQWKPEQKNIPYKLQIRINRDSIDTIIHNQNSFLLTEQLFKTDSSAALLAWNAVPSDSKSTIRPFLAILPAANDKEIIEQQLKQLRTAYSKDPSMLRLLEKDLFERWMEVYQLR